MKRYLFLIFLLAGITMPMFSNADTINTATCSAGCGSGANCCSCPCGGKTFFSARPLYQTARPEIWSGFRNDRMNKAENGFSGAVDVVLFGSQSTNANGLASYFLPNCKQTLVVRENPAPFDNTDLASHNFNVITVNGVTLESNTGYEGTFSLSAKESVIGVGLRYKQGFGFSHERRQWWYVDTSSSIQQVKNRVTICENIINNGGGADTADLPQAVSTMTAAFNQSAWCYGKINSGCDLKKTGLADIELKLGYQWMWHEHCHYAGYFGLLIPTGNRPKAVHVFEAIVGNNHHWGLMSGTEGGFEIWTSRCEKWHLTYEFAAQGVFLFQNTQTRSFDLKNRPWSRYMTVYANQAQAQGAALLAESNAIQAEYLATPGINVFTQCVKVQPGFVANATSALTFAHDNGLELEAGYNFYARHAECVKLNNSWQVGPALKDISGDGETNPVRNITGNALLEGVTPVALEDYNQSLILAGDLDLNSAAHPDIIVNLFYGALTYCWDDRKIPVNVNAGASYEFARKDFAVMNRWVAWGKLGLSF